MRRPLTATVLLLSLGAPALSETRLTVMSFNIYGAGVNGTGSVEEVAAVIRAVNPDIVGIQETRAEADPCTADVCPAAGPSAARAVAEALGMNVHEQTAVNEALWANAILSRHPIGAPTANDLGVPVTVENRTVWVFNVHLDDSPYQPYQALDIEYGDAPFLHDPAALVEAARQTRGGALDLLKRDLAAADGAALTLVFGDFNEPSHLDWTEPAVKAGLQPYVVDYPFSRALAELGFVDTFRARFPDVVAKPGFTWTPTSEPTDPEDHHDRIDFAYARAERLTVLEAGIVGEKAPEADVVVTPWPSDHRATYARIDF